MKVLASDKFLRSIKRIRLREIWYNKIYYTIRHGIPEFIKNVWRFRKVLWEHRWWDHHSMLEFNQIALLHIADNIESKGLEVDKSRLKKVKAMRRAAEIIKNYNLDLYIEMAEGELGPIRGGYFEFETCEGKPDFFEIVKNETEEEKSHNSKVYKRSNEIEEREWNELWELFRGQDYAKWQNHIKQVYVEPDQPTDYDEWFDGSGLRGWWD
jgi:hypothetical protein